jgi:hypothetical protein
MENGKMGASCRKVSSSSSSISSMAMPTGLPIHQIGFAQHDHAGTGTQKREDVQVFAGLGHDTVVGRHNEDGSLYGTQIRGWRS